MLFEPQYHSRRFFDQLVASVILFINLTCNSVAMRGFKFSEGATKLLLTIRFGFNTFYFSLVLQLEFCNIIIYFKNI